MILSYSQILKLAADVLSVVPHHPAVTKELCAAIVWKESRGNASAVGDTRKAVGIAQFHWSTYSRFAANVRCLTNCNKFRYCPRCSMIALVCELDHAIRHKKWTGRVLRDGWIYIAANFHNRGTLSIAPHPYARDVKRIVEVGAKRWDREQAKARKSKARKK